MRFLLFLVLLINLFLLNSCKKYVAAEPAFFIKPSLVSVSTTTAQGSNSSKITDLWVYVNGQFQGAYPTGNLIPIITNNASVKVNVLPGIKNNGISATRLSWIFYNYITIDTFVENHKTITRPFTFTYNPNTTFGWMENFEGQGFSLVRASSINNPHDTTWKFASPEDSFEGRSAEIGLTPASPSGGVQVESSVEFPMPLGTSNVYLELNYKSNAGFEVGILNGETDKSMVFVNASTDWNKIYISLADAVNRAPSATTQKIYFKMARTTDNQYPKMFLDNIKLVYLQ